MLVLGFIVSTQILKVVWAGLVVAIGDVDVDDVSMTVIFVAGIGLWLCYGPGTVALAAQRAGSVGAGLRALGIDGAPRPASVGLGAAAGVASQFVLVPIVYLVLRGVIDPSSVDDAARELADRAATTGDRILLVVLAALIAPIVEELAFRGLVLGGLGRVLPVVPALGIQAVLFGVVHDAVITWPGLIVFGLVLGWLRLRHGLLAAIAAHMTFNAATLVVLLGDLDLPF